MRIIGTQDVKSDTLAIRSEWTKKVSTRNSVSCKSLWGIIISENLNVGLMFKLLLIYMGNLKYTDIWVVDSVWSFN